MAVSTQDGEFIASGELATAPSIHVWSRKTLESLCVIKGDHAQGVHLLAFTYDNKFLVTCGITTPSAVIIYDWRNSQVAMSTSIHSPTQEILLMHEIKYPKGQNDDGDFELNFNDQENVNRTKRAKTGIAVLSLEELCVFVPKENSFDQTLTPLKQCVDEVELFEPMCGLALIADSENNFFGALDIEMGG